MPAKKNPMTEAERSRRFAEKARELECAETTEAFDRVLGKILPPKRPLESLADPSGKKRNK
jgi:hypothetical protein